MDYEKAYKEALNKAKSKIENDKGHVLYEDDIIEIFPELAESEDEKIRKDCIKYLDWEYKHCSFDEDKMKIEKCVSWLEKQKTIGESLNISTTEECEKYYKAIDNCLDNKEIINMCQPKFKEGDYVANDDSSVVAQIEGVSTNGFYYTFKNIKPSISYSAPNCEFVDKYYHLWTIEDAKNGDVLYCDNGNNKTIYLFKEQRGSSNIANAYFQILNMNNELKLLFNKVADFNLNTKPATKEQRDTLFTKMKEAGYTWYAEKKELIKII